MLPLRDDIPSRTVPYVNYSLIVICVLVFLVQWLSAGLPQARLEERFGMVPARVVHPDVPLVREALAEYQGRLVRVELPLASSPLPAWMTLFTCMFLHGGWLHLIGNLWSLWIFGDNVEDRLGHVGYLLFYLASGIAAGLAHLVVHPDSAVPTIGASGAIAGVMGAYLLFYPNARVQMLVWFFYFVDIVVAPASLFLGMWFLLQFFQGTFALTGGAGGVAWWAHIGGFAMGFLVAALLRAIGETSPPVLERRFVRVPRGDWDRDRDRDARW